MKDLYIIGAGGQGRELLWIVREINARTPTYNVRGFLDDDPKRRGEVLCDVPVLGPISILETTPGASAALAIGIPRVKKVILAKIGHYNVEWPTFVAPGVVRSDYVTIGRGAMVCAGSILTTQVTIGEFALVNVGCTVSHDASVGRGSSLAPGVHLTGHVRVGEYTDVGTGTSVIPGVHIGDNCVVGAGAVIIRPVPDGVTVVGNPGRILGDRG